MKKQFINPAVRVIKYDSESLMNPGSLNGNTGTLGTTVSVDDANNVFAPTRQGIFGDSDF